MAELEERLARACRELGLRIELGVTVALPSGARIAAAALLPDLGARRGMLVVRAYDSVKQSLEELRREGWAFSVLEDGRPGAPFDRESYAEMFRDWGWSGPPSARPAWLAE